MLGWTEILDVSDAPKRDFFCAFIEKEYKHDEINDANIGSSGIGFLSWDLDHKWWSIIEDGEIITPPLIYAICEVPDPRILNK